MGRLILSDRAAKQNCEAHAARSAQTACHVRAGFNSALPSGKKIKNIIARLIQAEKTKCDMPLLLLHTRYIFVHIVGLTNKCFVG